MSEEEFRGIQIKALYRNKIFHEYEKEILDVYGINKNRKLNISSVYDYLEEKYGTLPGSEKTLRNYINLNAKFAVLP